MLHSSSVRISGSKRLTPEARRRSFFLLSASVSPWLDPSACAALTVRRSRGDLLPVFELPQVLRHHAIILRQRLRALQKELRIGKIALLEVRATAGAPGDRALSVHVDDPAAVGDRFVVGL